MDWHSGSSHGLKRFTPHVVLERRSALGLEPLQRAGRGLASFFPEFGVVEPHGCYAGALGLDQYGAARREPEGGEGQGGAVVATPRAGRRVSENAILLVHWLLTTWGCLLFSGSYAWANFSILALGVWAVAQRDSIDAISMFLGGLVVTIILDIIHISIFYPLVALTDTGRFGAGMAILSLLLKPFSCCLVYHMYRERGGEFLLHVGFLGPSPERSAYQTIDTPEVSSDSFAGPENRDQASRKY
ncbi:PREDICTED: type-1 angiotensin II receptor-associated protein [Chrysochloris asiatica]|uniref:Type-1 angiotensin II receptor-associated protein n=1 Tax=Chrysochloris asiatica TaxID=185453 RepID=A0A9B0WRS3_CHRAS|nr:PREDICTED: type-1 angiotensin II receptor-associated protein [Chrysochloris asiatica]